MNRLTLLLALAVAMPCYAKQGDEDIESDRPGFADSSKVPPRGRMQLEAGFQREKRRADEDPRRQTILPTLVRIGVADKWEARIESELYAWMRMERVRRHGRRSLWDSSISFSRPRAGGLRLA